MEIPFSYVVFNMIFIVMLIYYCYQLHLDKKVLQKQLDGDIDALSNDRYSSTTLSKNFNNNANTNTGNNNADIAADVENTTFASLS